MIPYPQVGTVTSKSPAPLTAKVLHFALLILLFLLSQPPSGSGHGQKDVLILNSFHENLPWSRELMKGFCSKFDNVALNLELHVEYMDTLRHPGPHLFDELTALYRKKYRDLRPKVIITTGHTALEFLLARREALFSGIPVVFCSAGTMDRKRIFDEKEITGVFDPPSIKETLELALRLHPSARRVAVIGNREAAGTRRHLQQIAPLFENRVEFTLLTDESLQTLRNKIRNLAHTTLLLFFSPGKGDDMGSRDILKALTRDFNLPVYTVRKIDVGRGSVGGMVTSAERMAGLAADMAVRVITGDPPDAVPVVEPSPLALFDFVALKRFGISRSILPEGSIVINRPFSFYGKYRKLVLKVGATIAVLVLFIALLFINISRRRDAEQEVQQACLFQEKMVERRTRELTLVNQRLQREIGQRKEVNRALRESEALFNSFMAHLPGRAFIKDRKGRYIYLSETYKKLLNMDPAGLIGSTDKDIWPGNLAAVFTRNDHLAMEKEDSMTCVERIPVDGEVQHHLITRFPLFKNQRLEKLAAVAFDISERVKAEAERKKLASMLIQSQKIESIGTLAGGIAHDFNNLLMGIQGNIAIIEMRTEKEHPNLTKIAVIKELIASGADLTKQLLGFARGGKYDVRPVNINELLKKCIKMFGRTRKGVTLYDDFEEAAWTVAVDGGQIEQVLLNVLINASNAMPEGGEIHTTTRNITLDEKFIRPHKLKPGKYVKISVRDTGIGMDENTKVRIFDPFFTTSEMGRGTGLGLASAYGIVKNHKGFITVYSEKGKGATFNIYLPRTKKRPMAPKTPHAKLLKGSGFIMLVDDEAYIRDIADHILSRIGYRVLTADSGKRAVELYKEKKEEIDLVVLDMVMPNMGGGKTFAQLKKIDPDCRILIASGYSIDSDTKKLLKENRDAYIQKPFSITKLAEKIDSILETPG